MFVPHPQGRDGELHGELGPVAPHRGELDGATQDRTFAGREVMPQPVPMGFSLCGRDDRFGDHPSQRFVARPPESFFRLTIPPGDRAALVHRDERVVGAVDDEPRVLFRLHRGRHRSKDVGESSQLVVEGQGPGLPKE